MYQDKLKAQWENLIAELDIEQKKTPSPINGVTKHNEWFKVKAFQYSSISSVESLQLRQAGSQEFVEEFRNKLNSFSFHENDSINKSKLPPWFSLVVGILVALVIFFVAGLFTKLVFRIVLTIIGFFAGVAIYTVFVKQKAEKKEAEHHNEAYIKQLSDLLNELLAICEKHGVK